MLIYGSGIPTSKRKMSENSWRWQPLLQLLYDKIRNLSSIEMSLANMMTDASQAVLKITGLAELLASEDVNVFAERMRILTMGRGIRVLPIDEDETYEYIERTFTGIGDVYDRIASVLSGTSRVPQVLLFGKSNPGLSNEDITADRYWSGQATSMQTEWARGTTRLIRIAAQVTGARDPQGWHADFDDVWQKTPEEKSAHIKSVAESDKIYKDMEALLPEEIAVKRFGSGEFDDGTPQIDKEARQAMIEGDMERMKEGPREPEEMPIPPQMPVPLEQAEPQVIGQTKEPEEDEE
jgi:phage-related protein (TIGR01555 family)